MNIALIGYGKMGKAIEQVALQRGHQVILRIGRQNREEFSRENLVMADVAIEFTSPESAPDNVLHCLDAGVPVICGSTGWNDRLYLAKEKCAVSNGAFLQASNFSIGVNIFFEINKQLASLMNDWPEYEVSIEETHHTAKKDAPSGTAITLAEQVIDNLERKKHWQLDAPSGEEVLPIKALREDEVPGTHRVHYRSAIDDIEIAHTAHSREGFALGAVLAAEFIRHRKGIFTMSDVLAGNAR
ncbi:4-hydroxy-tetrahydrodipicolinate reductase [Taibaiella koreensis]|uniref:4-hydroxy-tetrahydrodipicolinate reductase n=1 Tax=Taibaiella koreensis TaxID=1268548 RepID=UPI000E59F53D|nr:4-hydroxy-tetrahydrodipicolinate reductase [Taibaiella koreensis]